MSDATITLIIIACVSILYITERHSVAVTTVLGMLALIFTGILDFNEAFACFTSTNVMLVLGMIIIVESLLDSGVAEKLGLLLFKFTGKSEKFFLVVVFVSAAVLSLFFTNAALVAMYMPLISSVCGSSHGNIRRKHIYLPLAMGGLIGGTGSLAGSTAPLLVNNVLEETGAQTMGFFGTLPVASIMVAVVALCYWLFLYDLQVKWFDFEEATFELGVEDYELDKKKAVISPTVFLTCIILFIIQPFDWELGLIAVAGAVVLMVTGCVDGQHAMSNMQWSALVTLGAALAVAKGFVKSGVGELIMDWLMVTLGPWVVNPIVLVTVFLVAGFVLSQAGLVWVEISILLAGALLVLIVAEAVKCRVYCGLAAAIFMILMISHFESSMYLYSVMRAFQTIIGVSIAWFINVKLLPYPPKPGTLSYWLMEKFPRS